MNRCLSALDPLKNGSAVRVRYLKHSVRFIFSVGTAYMQQSPTMERESYIQSKASFTACYYTSFFNYTAVGKYIINFSYNVAV